MSEPVALAPVRLATACRRPRFRVDETPDLTSADVLIDELRALAASAHAAGWTVNLALERSAGLDAMTFSVSRRPR